MLNRGIALNLPISLEGNVFGSLHSCRGFRIEVDRNRVNTNLLRPNDPHHAGSHGTFRILATEKAAGCCPQKRLRSVNHLLKGCKLRFRQVE